MLSLLKITVSNHKRAAALAPRVYPAQHVAGRYLVDAHSEPAEFRRVEFTSEGFTCSCVAHTEFQRGCFHAAAAVVVHQRRQRAELAPASDTGAALVIDRLEIAARVCESDCFDREDREFLASLIYEALAELKRSEAQEGKVAA